MLDASFKKNADFSIPGSRNRLTCGGQKNIIDCIKVEEIAFLMNIRRNMLVRQISRLVPVAAVALTGMVSALSTSAARAQTFAIDQHSDTFSFSYRLSDNTQTDQSALGQSFVPTFSRMNAIALYLSDADPFRSNGTTLSVSLHSDSITGTVLGTTGTQFIPNNYQKNPGGASGGLVTFLFASDIPITPGAIYVLEATRVSGDDVWIAAMGSGGNTYTSGDAIVKGVAQHGTAQGADLSSQTGEFSADEPSSEALLAVVPIALAFLGSRFRLRS